jgi:hypothetical protein
MTPTLRQGVNDKLRGTAVLGIDHRVDVSAAVRMNASALSRRTVLRVVLATGVALPLAGCWRDKFEFNQKLKVTVSTPQGEKSGAAVTSVVTYIGTILLSGSQAENRISGEATVVEVMPGKYLFALIGEKTNTIALRAWEDRVASYKTEDKLAVIEDLRESVVLPPKLYPMLVTFDDINNPITVRELNPANLAATFGDGILLTSITLEITSEPITTGLVENKLPWVVGLNGGYLHGGITSKGAPLGLHAGNFLTGSMK